MMNSWQLTSPVDALIFDCDSTLTAIEGIDELAALHGVGIQVTNLTNTAMSTTGINPHLYQQRLDLVKPSQQEVNDLGLSYYQYLTPDVIRVIYLCKRLNKTLYILSAGLYPSLVILGQLIGIPEQQIFAVPIFFDEQGNYKNYDHSSPLIHNDGKRLITQELLKIHQHIAYVGDGMNDYSVHDNVTRFIGYGGVAYRKNMADLCHYYIKTPSLAPMIPLILTEQEVSTLSPDELELYQQGIHSIESGDVKVPH